VPRWLVMTTTFVFGIVPATLMVVFACMMSVAGLLKLFDTDASGRWMAPLFIVVGPMALIGYVALFRAAGASVNSRTAQGLAVGVLANLFGLSILLSEPEYAADGGWYLYSIPLVVACAHLFVFLARRVRRVPSA
jgi:hypothetical protein